MKNKVSIALILFGLINFLLAQSDSAYNSLWAKWNNHKLEDSVRCKALDDLIWSHYLVQRSDSALIVINQMYDYALLKRNIDYQVKALNAKGGYYFYTSALDEGMECFEQSIKLSKLNGDLKGEAAAHSNISNIYLIQGKYEKAIESLFNSLNIKIKSNDEKGVAGVYESLSRLYMRKGDYKRSIDYLFKSLKVFEKLGEKHRVAKLHNSLGLIYTDLEDYAKAEENLNKSIEICRALGEERDLYYSLSNLGGVYMREMNYEKSLEVLKEAELGTKQLEDVTFKVGLALSIGSTYYCMEEHDSAMYYVTKSLNESEKYNDFESKMIGLNTLGMIYYEKGDYNLSEKYSKASYNLAKESGNVEKIKDAALNLAETYEQKGLFVQSLEMHKIYTKMKDSIANNGNQRAMVKADIEYSYEMKKFQDSLNQEKLLSLKNMEIATQRARNTSNIILVVSIMGLLLLVGVFYYFQYKNRNEKEILTLKNQALRLQINPHFFFNAMNSINRYIGNNEPIMAKSYLTKFSKVMRLSLDSVQEDVVPLSQEIEFLTNYIEIEKLQHKNFEYEIVVEESLDVDEIVVPPILIQPYIENAILHGFINKTTEEKGNIKVVFSKKEAFLSVMISDNGVGIESTQVIKSEGINHKSLAMKITQKRINAFSKKNVEIDFSSLSEGVGTVIKFKIPVIRLT